MPNKTGDFLPLQLTNIGRDMLTQGRAGHVLTFTKVAIGEGTATGTAVDSLTALKSHKLYLPISKNETVHAGQMRLQFRVNNKVVTTGFYFREIGLYAKVDNGQNNYTPTLLAAIKRVCCMTILTQFKKELLILIQLLIMLLMLKLFLIGRLFTLQKKIL